jgi:hypothetical protein
MVEDLDWEWQKLCLKDKLGNTDGDAFESLFQDLAKAAWGSDFTSTIPMGRRGDLKCDGYRASTRTVFQCYGPRYGQANVSKAISKIDEDFQGAAAHWKDQICRWVFVVNLYKDKVPSEIIKRIREIERDLTIPATPWTRAEVCVLAKEIPPADRIRLLGRAPLRSDMIRNVTYANIGRALAFIRADIARSPLEPVLLPPPVQMKVEWNLLCHATRHFLAIGQIAAEKVRQYLRSYVTPEEAQRMADGFTQRYKALSADGFEPDQIFGQMVIFAGGTMEDTERNAAALAIVAHFFSTCEIFERPPEEASLP